MAEITVRKLVIQPDSDSPQLLMVVGTTRLQGDLWVHIGESTVKLDALADATPITELARYVSVDERGAGEVYPDAAHARNQKNPFHGVTCGEGEALWVARFYFENHRACDHRGVEREDLSVIWSKFASPEQQDEPQGLRVTAWCTESPADWRESSQRSDPTLLGKSKPRSMLFKDVEQRNLYDLGILLVHGIGPHKVRETLINFGEPIVNFWTTWLAHVTDRAAASFDDEQRQRFVDRVSSTSLRHYGDREGIVRELERFKSGSGAEFVSGNTQQTTAGVLCGSVRAEDTLLMPEHSGDPASTLIRQTLVGDDGKLRESHVLMSEAWWTAETVYPKLSELSAWIWTAFPAILRMHLGTILRPDWNEAVDSFRSASWRRFPNLEILLAKVLVYAPLVIVLGVLAQAALLLLGVLSMVPIPWFKRVIRSLVDVLMGTIGQSYALKTSQVRRNAMVRSVARDLDWLQARCDEVVVISHSQGAEITRLVFQAGPRPQVTRWITLGSGIKPLSLLEKQPVQSRSVFGFSRLFNLSTSLLLFMGVAGLFQLVYPQKLIFGYELGALIEPLWSVIPFVAIPILYLLLEAGLVGKKPAPILRLRESIRGRWDDYYASHDPVSAGSMFEAYGKEKAADGADDQASDLEYPKEKPIQNERSIILDHTSYFSNLEQFVAPVALELFAKAGDVSKDDPKTVCERFYHPSVKAALADASERRRNNTWWRMLVDYAAMLLLAVSIGWSVFGAGGSWPMWQETVFSQWAAADGIVAGMAAVWNPETARMVIADLWYGVYVVLAFLLARVLVARRFRKSGKELYKALASAFDSPQT